MVQLGNSISSEFISGKEERPLNRRKMKQNRWFFKSCGPFFKTFSPYSQVINLYPVSRLYLILVSLPLSTQHIDINKGKRLLNGLLLQIKSNWQLKINDSFKKKKKLFGKEICVI